jgi:hypothetical protein
MFFVAGWLGHRPAWYPGATLLALLAVLYTLFSLLVR